jgi:Flp pilus assembly protein TadD
LVLVVAVSGLAGSVVVARRRYPLVAWCVVWVLAGLAPLALLPWLTVKGLLQENRLTFSAVALAWLTAVAIRALAAICAKRTVGWSLTPVGLFGGLVVAISVAGIVSAVAVDRTRSAVWNDDVRLWEEAVRLSPASRSAHLNLGASLMGRGEEDAAEREFRLALDLAPGEAHAYYALGRLALRRERLEEARDWLEQAIARAPEYSGSYHALGDVAMKLRDPAADVAFRRALALNPRDAKALAKLGLLAQQTGDRAAAETFYRAALAQDPDHAVARNNLGILYIQRRDWPRAFEQFAAAVRRDPDDLDAVYNEAITLDMLGRKDEARAILKRLLARLPPDPKFDSHRRGAQAVLHQARP